MRDIGGYSTEYEIQVWEGHENSLDPSLVKLDPINVARRADMEKLRKAAERMRLPFSIRALKICSDLSVFLSLVKQPMIKPWEKPVSAKKWDEHVKALALYGVVEEIEFPQLKNGARYFGVMKGRAFDLEWSTNVIALRAPSERQLALFATRVEDD